MGEICTKGVVLQLICLGFVPPDDMAFICFP